MFKRGYFELIGITDPALYHDHLTERLERYAGLHLIAMGSDDGHGLARTLDARIDGIAAPYDFTRDVPFGDGAREGSFRIVQLDGAAFPDGDMFFIQHLSRDVLWQPDLLTHPNGVTDLAGVTICVADVAASQGCIAALLDGGGDGGRFGLAAGSVEIIDQAALGARYPGITPPAMPWVAAVDFTVADMAALTGLLAGNGVATNQTADGGLWVESEGAVVVFRE
jgi:hypothetical protein